MVFQQNFSLMVLIKVLTHAFHFHCLFAHRCPFEIYKPLCFAVFLFKISDNSAFYICVQSIFFIKYKFRVSRSKNREIIFLRI